MSHHALVSIGLPVYNGENYLAVAIESILRQSFRDFELIICDNASTDRTEEICRAFAAGDDRIHYHRNERNLGAAPNFNRVFALASGRYFKWMAHDDVLAPDFLAASLAALEAQPDAVLCYSEVDIIDGRGEIMGPKPSRLPGTESPRASDRFAAAILIPHMCYPVFALIRRDVLRDSALMASYDGADRGLVAELALRGRFAYVADPLFSNRDHPARYIRAVRPQPATSIGWWDQPKSRKIVLHYWTLYRHYFRMVEREVSQPVDRLRCYGHLARWLAVDWNLLRLMVDVVGAVDPRVFVAARMVKQRLFGPA